MAGTAGDRSTLDRLRASGVDMSRLRDVAHTLQLPNESSARLAAEAVRQPERTVVIGPFGDSSGCPVIVFVQQPLTLDAIETLRNEYRAIATDLGGSYEGWSLATHEYQGDEEDG
ncbi:MAG TPA: ribonuclease E inhibitor RraB [Candidatus Limnocylindrales bacterium]